MKAKSALCATCLFLTGCFTGVDSEFIALRDDALPRGSIRYEQQFQHKIILGLAKKVVKDENPTAAAILEDLKMVQVGVCVLSSDEVVLVQLTGEPNGLAPLLAKGETEFGVM